MANITNNTNSSKVNITVSKVNTNNSNNIPLSAGAIMAQITYTNITFAERQEDSAKRDIGLLQDLTKYLGTMKVCASNLNNALKNTLTEIKGRDTSDSKKCSTPDVLDDTSNIKHPDFPNAWLLPILKVKTTVGANGQPENITVTWDTDTRNKGWADLPKNGWSIPVELLGFMGVTNNDNPQTVENKFLDYCHTSLGYGVHGAFPNDSIIDTSYNNNDSNLGGKMFTGLFQKIVDGMVEYLNDHNPFVNLQIPKGAFSVASSAASGNVGEVISGYQNMFNQQIQQTTSSLERTNNQIQKYQDSLTDIYNKTSMR